jgi:tail protein
MSIDKVEVMNSQGNLLTLSLEDISNGYVVKDIDGLDPVKATIVTSNFATMDGEQKQSSKRETRNITIQLGYAPDYTIDETVRSLRSRLYGFFMTSSDVTLTFYMTDGLTVAIAGTVETCAAPLFSKEPQMDISIICFDPDFIDVDLVQMHSTFVTTDTTSKTINVPGTVPTGLTSLSFTAPKTLSEFTIYHTTPAGELRTMTVSAPLVLNDVVNICTIRGQKSITLTRTGITTSLLWAVSPESTWVELEPGDNQFYLFASATNPAAIFVDFNNRYGGL